MAPGPADAPALWLDSLDRAIEVQPAWRQGYDRVYLSPRASIPAVIAARRCLGLVGSVAELGLYDLRDAGVPFSPAWHTVEAQARIGVAAEPELARHRESVVSYLLRQISSSVGGAYSPPPDGVVHLAFFAVEPRHHDEFNDWYELEHAPAILGVPGYLNIRRYQGIEDDRVFVALYDVESVEIAEGPVAAEAMQSRWSERVRSRLVTYRERRIFRVERLVIADATSPAP